MTGLVDHDLPPTDADIIFYQTAAGPDYEEMIRVTEPCHREYCRINRLNYVVEKGVRRGFHAWQASLNRIEKVNELLNADFRGWFVYLDADAVIHQMGFGLRRYLGKRANAALIAAPGGPEHWNINSGIFFLNFGHPLGREIARRWHATTHSAITEQMLAEAAAPWQPLPDGREFPDDQHLLQMELIRDVRLADSLLVDNSGLINLARGRFIRQFMRAVGAPEDRLALLRETVKASGF